MNQCKFEGCDRQVVSHGLCGSHNRQRLRTGILKPITPRRNHCTEDNCNDKHYAKGLCRYHYYRVRHKKTRKEKRTECVICGSPVAKKGFCSRHYTNYFYQKKTNGEKLSYYKSFIE